MDTRFLSSFLSRFTSTLFYYTLFQSAQSTMTLSRILYVKISMDPVNQVNIIQYRQLYCFMSFAKFTSSFLNRCFLFGKELFNAENNNHFSRHYRQKQRQCHLLYRHRGGIMSMNGNLSEKREVNYLGNDISGLNDVYREIADEIGIENAVAIYRLFRGTQVSFPSRLLSKEHIHNAIINEYNGDNVLQLAQKYNYSERSIWRILKTNK